MVAGAYLGSPTGTRSPRCTRQSPTLFGGVTTRGSGGLLLLSPLRININIKISRSQIELRSAEPLGLEGPAWPHHHVPHLPLLSAETHHSALLGGALVSFSRVQGPPGFSIGGSFYLRPVGDLEDSYA